MFLSISTMNVCTIASILLSPTKEYKNGRYVYNSCKTPITQLNTKIEIEIPL